MQTLWGKGAALDAQIAAFTIGDDRTIDAQLAVQDILGSLAHLQAISSAQLISADDTESLRVALQNLYAEAVRGELVPEDCDEDIHSAVERVLTSRLGDAGKRIHVARSRNDQVATDVTLWMRDQLLGALSEVLLCAQAAIAFAKRNENIPLVGMTHMQPAMPSSVGLWAAGYAASWLDDASLLCAALDAVDACPLGSAAGYGVPYDKAPIDRTIAAKALGLSRVLEPVTAVQGGRGKAESTVLFGAAQAVQTCARMAWDIVLYVHPDWGFVRLPDAFVTGSSIMPQKRNPDVLELVRGKAHGVRAALVEVMGLAGSLPGGYHRDFQLLKGPLMRGVGAAREILRVMAHVLGGLEVNAERAEAACRNEIYATDRALELVVGGVPFRDAYRRVAQEVTEGTQFAKSEGPRVQWEGLEARLGVYAAKMEHETRRVAKVVRRLIELR